MRNVLIGINGRIGSGKDTVGMIIQYLTNKHKYDSFESFIKSSPSEESKVFKIKKFAGKLKEVASIITGIPVEKFEDQEFKKTYLSVQWDRLFSISPSLPEERVRMTVREFLQKLGTECVRDGLHQNAWVNALFAEADNISINKDADGKITVQSFVRWVITDMRFRNEFEAVKKRCGITIRVNRGEQNLENLHSSETALDNFVFDYEIDNNGTIDELIQSVKGILTIEGII